jgi:tetratricopeptide (TPR) repeat protein
MLRKSQGRYREAESLLKEELAHRQQTMGSNHASTLNALTSLAFFYLDQAQFASAVPYYEQATAIYHQGVNDDFDSLVVLTMLGLCRHKSGDHAQAKANLETAKHICESTLSEHWLEFVIESLLGEVYLDLDQRNQAEDALLRGYTGLKSLEQEIPARWKPLGLRAATRRLAEFYESSDADDLRARAELYRSELAALLVIRQTKQISPTNDGQIGSSKDGDQN